MGTSCISKFAEDPKSYDASPCSPLADEQGRNASYNLVGPVGNESGSAGVAAGSKPSADQNRPHAAAGPGIGKSSAHQCPLSGLQSAIRSLVESSHAPRSPEIEDIRPPPGVGSSSPCQHLRGRAAFSARDRLEFRQRETLQALLGSQDGFVQPRRTVLRASWRLGSISLPGRSRLGPCSRIEVSALDP